jgi:hypothetical protein
MSPEDFLELTQRDINIKLIAYSEERDAKIARDWQLAQLVAIAMNDPKKFPKLDKLLPKPQVKRQLDDNMREEARAIGMRIPG